MPAGRNISHTWRGAGEMRFPAMFMWRASSLLTWEGEDGEHGRPVPMGLLVKPHVSADPYLVLNHVFSDGPRRRFHSLVLVLVLYSHTLKSEF